MKLEKSRNHIIMLKIMLSILILGACANGNDSTSELKIDPQQEKYWYSGEAEITSFKLNQARYGEMHEGTSVMIFVTEPFSKSAMTKADYPTDKDPSVLKLNQTKNFYTGIYPYSMMTSTFVPFEKGDHSLKISTSSQEWCGHVYMEMENKNKFELETNSYFQGQSGKKSLDKNLLEDDVWSLIRLRPESLPTGNTQVIPSFFYLALSHEDKRAYQCTTTKGTIDKNTSSYTLDYPEIGRKLIIKYETAFPHKILGWEETHFSGFGKNRQTLVTTGERINTIKSNYWSKHSNADEGLRDELFKK